MSADSISTKFQEPLPSVGGYIKRMWSSKEPVVFEITEVLADNEDVEVVEEKQQELIEEIKADLKEVEKVVEQQEVFVEEIIDFDKLNISDIIERLRCKCKAYKDKYMKSKKYDHSSISSKRSKFSKHQDEDDDEYDCKEFLNVKDYATYFIDNILEEATAKANETMYGTSREPSVANEYEAEIEQEIEEESIPTVSSSQISNLLIGHFSPKLGRDLVLNIIFTWSLKKNWSFCVVFLQENSDSCSDFYVYEVKWSLPTMSYPIPQVTASVFFTITVSRVQSKRCPVTVSYTFETERYKFLPEDDIHHEVFLDNIMKSKLDFFRNLRI